jgi:transposase
VLKSHQHILRLEVRVLATQRLVKDQTVEADATAPADKAELRSTMARGHGERYQNSLPGLPKVSRIETPIRNHSAMLDRKQKKRMSNEDWEHPLDPDANVTKMNDGSKHLAHKADVRSIGRRARSLR